jgi:carbon-monoxide dehydrogenase medium subunit
LKPAKFDFHAPRTLDEAVALLGRYGEDARVLAGGQSLVPLLNFRILQPRALISINHCSELGFLERRGDALGCGALTRQIDAERSALVSESSPLLAAALPWVGGAANRNRGTVCGSLAHADPLAELPAVAVALDATFHIRGPNGMRALPAAEFFIGDLTTAIEPGEMLVSVDFPVCGSRTGAAFVEIGNRAHGFAVVGVAAQIELSETGRCHSVRLAAIGVDSTPVRLRASEQILLRADRVGAAIRDAASISSAGLSPPGSFQADSVYKTDVVATLVERALLEAYALCSTPSETRQ